MNSSPHTISFGVGRRFDLLDPYATDMTIEDYAYALAYTVRWRGQARFMGRHVFYGDAEHCWRGALRMLSDGRSANEALAFLMHESDEVPLGDMPGPFKIKMPEYCEWAKVSGDAIDDRFRVPDSNKTLIKLYDLRMLATERRDLMAGYDMSLWRDAMGARGHEEFRPFDEMAIVPFEHPTEAAEAFLDLYRTLGGYEPA